MLLPLGVPTGHSSGCQGDGTSAHGWFPPASPTGAAVAYPDSPGLLLPLSDSINVTHSNQ